MNELDFHTLDQKSWSFLNLIGQTPILFKEVRNITIPGTLTASTSVVTATLSASTSVVTPIVDSGSTGSLSLKTNNGQTQVSIRDLGGNAANQVVLAGGISTLSVLAAADGTDSNIDFRLATKGTGSFSVFTNGTITNGALSAGSLQFQVLHTASANRNITVTGSNGGNPTIGVTAGNLAITPNVVLSGTLTGPSSMLSPITNSLGSDVALNNQANYFDGPSIAQGTSGTWFVSGTVTVNDTSAQAQFDAKLWDGTTVIASASEFSSNVEIGSGHPIALSGFITSPAGNLRISVRDLSTTNGNIKFNVTGNSKDSTITAIRIG